MFNKLSSATPDEPVGRVIAGAITVVAGAGSGWAVLDYGQPMVASEMASPTFNSVPSLASGVLLGVALAIAMVILSVVLLGVVTHFGTPHLYGMGGYSLVGLGLLVGVLTGAGLGVGSALVGSFADSLSVNLAGERPLVSLATIAVPGSFLSYKLWRSPDDAPTFNTADEPSVDPTNVDSERVGFTAETARTPAANQSSSEDTVNDTGGEETDSSGNNGTSQESESSEEGGNKPGDFEYHWSSESDVTFADVGGFDDIKRELERDIIRPLTTEREKAEKLDIPVPNILFHGPPGTGKTFLGQALANELGLPFAKLSGSDVQSKWINESPEKISNLFSEAKKVAAMEGGAVVFIDELDSVLRERTSGAESHAEDSKVVNEFLNHLQDTDDNNVVFIGATNRPDILDEAGTRAGRIDKKYEIGMPDLEARTAILKAQLKDRPTDLTEQDLYDVAHETEGAVAADIESLVVESARHSAFERGDDVITRPDLEAALDVI